LSYEDISLLKNIDNKWILEYNNLINNDIINKNYYILNKTIIKNSNKQEFITIFDDSLSFLFIDKSLIISFLKTLPTKYHYEIDIGIRLNGYGIDNISRITEWDLYGNINNSDQSDNLNKLIDIILNKDNTNWNNDFMIKWYPKIYYWYLHIDIYSIDIDIDIDIELRKQLYDKITNLYYFNMPSEERALLSTVEHSWTQEYNNKKKI
jgi:hypothetical protein